MGRPEASLLAFQTTWERVWTEVGRWVGGVSEGRKWGRRGVGESGGASGAARGKIVAPEGGRFVFHCNFSEYVVLAVIRIGVWTKAAFGLKLPAKPPLSFHASG